MSPKKPTDSDPTAAKTEPSEEAALIHAHLAAISWIEARLFEPMTVKSIADRAGYSPSRFSRGFTRLQGESVMSYVRGRRLEAAMGRLLEEPDLRIVDLAFDSGFDSQEAFTRAFVRAFGHPPGRLRSLGPVRAMTRRKKAPAREPEIHERIEQVPELHLAGLVRRITPANPFEVPRTWQRLESLRGFPGELDASTYAVMLSFDLHGSSGEMLSALRVADDASPPAGLHRYRLPATTCAVFRHVVRRGDVFPQVAAARERIYSHYVPHLASRVKSPPFEVFPQGINVTPGSWVDHYFPLQE
jgi:AraC family transcriptional regulator